jgi:endonuclease YncB( thermonuclease family)
MNDTKITLKLGHDQFERNTADVYLSTGVNLAEKLLEEGLAVVSPDPDRCINYRSIESKATNNRIGVWSDSNFVLPFIWRQNQKE